MEKLEQKLVKLIEYKQKDALLNLIYDLTELPEKEVEYKIPKRVLDLKDKIYTKNLSLLLLRILQTEANTILSLLN